MSPQEDRIGRPCKVGKEQILALLKALELFVHQDEQVTLRMYDAKAQVITDAVSRFGVTPLPRCYDPEALGNVTPRYIWQWDPDKINLTGPQGMEALAATRPVLIGYILPPDYAGSQGLRGRPDPNATADHGWEGQVRKHSGGNPNSFGIAAWQIKEGEETIIAKRLAEIFSEAVNTKAV